MNSIFGSLKFSSSILYLYIESNLKSISILSGILSGKWIRFVSSNITPKKYKGEMTINKLIAILLGLVVVAIVIGLFISMKGKASDSINCICTPAYTHATPPGCNRVDFTCP